MTAEREIVFVDDPDRLAGELTSLDGDVIGLDVERADSHRYYRTAALVQLGTASRCLLVDSVALDDLRPVHDFVQGRMVVIHALENDLLPLLDAAVEPDRVADTSVAAAMLGLPTGLGPLLEELLDVQLTADKDKFQRADWEQRPIPDDMQAYAAHDVFHLPALWAELARRLDETGRRSWYDQELRATIEHTLADTRDWTRTKGSGRLSAEQRAILKALWEEREQLAQTHDIAPNRLIRDQTLVDLAEKPAGTAGEIVKRNRRRSGPLKEYAGELLAAQERGRQAPPEEKTSPSRGWSKEDRAVFDAMRRTRSKVAKRVGIDPGVLCPSRSLWGPVLEEPTSGAELCRMAELRPWQTELLAEPLWDAYERTRARQAED